MFEIIDIDALGRIGKLQVNDKKMITPNLFPVVHPSKNLISAKELKKIGAESLFTNAYLLYQNDLLREEVLKKGIHRHLNFPNGIIATDSGAFQQYMYNKEKISIEAKEIERFQEDIGSDFPVILDIPVQLDDSYEIAKEKVYTTISRAKDNINRRTNEKCSWFGPIHGAKYQDLLKISSTEMSKLNFGVYAIGGLVKAFLNYQFDLTIEILLNVKKAIRPDKPIHMFGLGLPQFFSLAVACGCDLMDSAAYVLFAKENRYFTLSTGTEKLEDLDEFPCHCPICCDNKPREVYKLEDDLRTELLAKHNLYLSFSELRTIRQAIREGNLWELVEQRIRVHPALMNAARLIRNYTDYFEEHEKIYKLKGRLYSSSNDLFRPLIKRYNNKLIGNYRIPQDAKYLIILPELDTRPKNSPSISKWLNLINNDTINERRALHVMFFSLHYGLIPIELIDTYPLSQYESIRFTEENGFLSNNVIQKCLNFYQKKVNAYKKIAILIPENYENQFGEIVKFSPIDPIRQLFSLLKLENKEKIFKFNNLNDILQFFDE
ncbi:MAG: tRNA guanosine(15) transglycosylase TgtA [Promethearchaeota archaeon]